MNGTCNKVYKSVIEEHENYNKSVIIVVLSDKTTYNKSIPILKWHEIREVQDCPKVINSMKYFCENAPQYHIACVGSLLGIALAKPSSFPVGKVNFMQIDPMTFTEFLMANGDENLVGYMFCITDAGDTV